MKSECFVIIFIVVLLMIDLLRRHLKNYALCCLPLVILPLFHILADFTVGRFISGDIASARVILITDLAATLATILFLFFLQSNIKEKRHQALYFSCTAGYSLLLATILILISIT